MFPGQALDLAMKAHQAGKLREAELLYRQILQEEPRHADALHLLGVIAHQVGRHELAVEHIQTALRERPNFAEAHCNLGVSLQALGQLEQAVASFRQAVNFKPDYAEAHNNLGNALRQQNKPAEAVASLQQALRLRPAYAGALTNLGAALQSLGRLDEAVSYHEQALRCMPNLAEAHNSLGAARLEQGKLDEAAAGFQQAVRLRPNYVEAHHNLGVVLKMQGKLDESAASLKRTLSLKPDHADAHNNLGAVLQLLDRLDEATASFQQVVRLKPDDAGAHNNLGGVLKLQGKLAEATASFQHALRLEPNLAEAHLNLAVQMLTMGDFAHGWPEFEWRWQTKNMKQAVRNFSQPLWQGNPLPQGTILLHAEQGLGDTIQFIRFATLVKQRVGNVICECPAALVRLLKSCAGIDRTIPTGEPLPAFDVHAPLLSLPGILKTTLTTIPANIPYLHANTALTEPQAKVLGSKDFKIGIVWQGNPRSWDPNLKRADLLRSFRLAHLEPLARLPGVRFISLQKGAGTEQIQELADRFPVAELGSGDNNFSDGGTAAVMKNLDLVISADTSPAHLAGALGVPVWVALPTTCCWRWLLDRQDSPWYPTMKLFRQTSPGDWSGVFERMTDELRGLLKRRTAK